MSRFSRLPLIVTCFGLGAFGALVAQANLQGQGTVPVPPAVQPAPAIARDPQTFRDVAKKVLPAVVSIEAKSLAAAKPVAKPLPKDVPEEFRKFFENEAEPKSEGNLGYGSGVLIDASGVVLTNYHVVEGADSVDIHLTDGRTFTSKDIRRDPKSDLAIVKITTDKPLPAIELGDSDAMEVGDRVLAVGAPFGLTGSVTHGIVSAKSRHNLRLNKFEDFIQTDAAINPGNSGGPLVNLDGQVIGINAAIKTKTGGFQGVGLAVSSNLAKDVSTQLLQGGSVKRGYLGVSVRDLSDELSIRLGVPKGSGVVIGNVTANSPASKAGLKIGDVITSLGDNPVKDVAALPNIVAKLRPNQEVQLSYIREGKRFAVNVIIDELRDDSGKSPDPIPVPATPPAAVPGLGLTVADLTPENAAKFGMPKTQRGVIVASVEKGSAASTAGLTVGQVIIKVDRAAVTTTDEFKTAIASSNRERGALLQILRASGEIDFAVLAVK